MFAAHIELILLITGSATASALVVFLAPATMLKALFGQAPLDSPGLLIARNWGLLSWVMGVLLIYSAHHSEIVAPTLVLVSIEKAVLAASFLSSPFRRRPAVFLIALADAGMAAIYIAYLISQ